MSLPSASSTDERAAPSAAGARTGGTALIFDWSPVRWRRTRLMVALVVAAGGHLLMFYLFQVATDPSPRQAPPVRQALILPGSGAGTRRLLEDMEDRLPSLNPPPLMTEPEGLALDALVKGYVPTWQNHRPALKPMPGQAGGSPLPPLFPQPAAPLPPLPEAGGEAAAAGEPRPENGTGTVRAGPAAVTELPARPWPTMSFQSGLADRQLLTAPVWPAAVNADEWPEEGTASFMLSVEADGRVSSCLSLGASAGLDESVLQGALEKMRFSAKEGMEGPQWGWVEVHW